MRSNKVSNVAVVISTIFALLLQLSWWAHFTVLEERGFAKAVVAVSSAPAVQEGLRRAIVEEVVESVEPRLVAARPLIEAAVSSALSAEAFSVAVDAVAVDLHRSVFEPDSPALTLQATRLVDQARELIRVVNPELASARGWDAAATLPLISEEVAAKAVLLEKWVDRTFALTAALWLVFTTLALWSAPSRRETVGELGMGLGAVAAISLVLHAIGGVELQRQLPPVAKDIGGEAFRAFTASLRDSSLWIGAVGLVAVASSAATRPDRPAPSLMAPVELAKQVAKAHTFKRHRVLQPLALTALGLGAVYWHDAAVSIAVIGAGAWVCFVGLYGLLEFLGQDQHKSTRRWSPSKVVPVVVILVLIGLLVFGFVRAQGIQAPSFINPQACNGHVDLCEKPVDKVVFPATHISMAAARSSGWFSPHHRGDIAQQLNDGIRAFLIDSYYGREAQGGVVLTDVDATAAASQAGDDSLSSIGLEQAEAIRQQANSRDADRDVYLCHTFCELGATRMKNTVEEISSFLASNPREVIVLFIQDAVPPNDVGALFEDAGLRDRLYSHVSGQWPTLGELIQRKQQILVMGENFGPPPSWYSAGFAHTEDTAYDFASIDEFNCAPNRGPAEAPFFLMNHWLSSVPPTADVAAKANSYEVLHSRVERCTAERGQVPNFVAVDFYDEGDLFEVVEIANGLRSPRLG